jgi:hypothetical protein
MVHTEWSVAANGRLQVSCIAKDKVYVGVCQLSQRLVARTGLVVLVSSNTADLAWRQGGRWWWWTNQGGLHDVVSLATSNAIDEAAV